MNASCKIGRRVTLPPVTRNPYPVTRGFTYIEVLITLAMMGVLFVPMMQLFSSGLSAPAVSSDVITACHLARWEMEKVKNLNLTTAQLKGQGDLWIPPLEEQPLNMNKVQWRIYRRINPESDPLEVSVEVFSADNLKKPMASLVTLIGDSIWTELKEGGVVRRYGS